MGVAKSCTIVDGTRHRNRERWAHELNMPVSEAELRLTEWLSVWKWLRYALGFRKKPIKRRPFVTGCWRLGLKLTR